MERLHAVMQDDKHISKLMQECYQHLERARQVLRSDVIIANLCHFPNRNLLRVWVKLETASSLNASSADEVYPQLTAVPLARLTAVAFCIPSSRA